MIGIYAGTLLTMRGGELELLADQLLTLSGNQIIEIQSATPQAIDALKAKARHWIDASQDLVMPGLINGHTHIPMSLLKGLADDLPFHQWLYENILPVENQLVNREFVKLGTELAALEMIASGTTTLSDMYYYSDEIASALDVIGLRAQIGAAFLDFPSPDSEGQPGTNQAVKFKMMDRLREFCKGHSRLTAAIAPHAPYTCSDPTLKLVRDYAYQYELPIVSHVSETKKEVDDHLKAHGVSAVERFQRLGLLGAKTSFAHCVHVSDRDLDLMLRSGTSAIYNPESNMKLGSGVAPIPKMLEMGVKVGMGTDGSASNNNLSLFGEMDSGAKIQKLVHQDNTAITAQSMIKMATYGGARALSLSSLTGSIEVGKRADLIVVDTQGPHWRPIHDYASQLVYSASGFDVRTMVCDGKILYENREFKTIDQERVLAQASTYTKKVASVVKKS